jgi:hypothetical protein
VIRAIAFVIVATSSAAYASHCHEVSPVVGHRHCGSFGSRWASEGPTSFVGGGMVLERIPVHDIDQTGTVASTSTSAGYHTQLAPGTHRSMWALGPSLSLGVRSAHYIIGFAMIAAIALDGPTTVTQVSGFAPMTATYSGGGELIGLFGAHSGAGPFDLGAIVAIGERDMGFPQNLPDGFTTCNGATGKNCGLLVEQDELIVEPRVYVGWWIDPRTSLEASAGYDVVGGGGAFALNLVVRGAPFDGR